MDQNSDSSMLSDELKPRRTPVPSSFGDTVPRPSVPDLSIIESPSAAVLHQNTAPPVPRMQSSLSHLSYNDWRQKTGAGVINGSPSNNRSTESILPAAAPPTKKSPYSYVPVSINSHINENLGYLKDRVEEHSHRRPVQPLGKTVSYSDFKPRPSSAPAPRTPPVETEVERNHPLSKSAPPNRSSRPVQSSNGPKGHFSSLDSRNYAHHAQARSVPIPPSNIYGHSSQSNQLHELNLLPTTDYNPQHSEAKRLMDNPIDYRQQHDKNHMINHGHVAYNEISSHHAVPTSGRDNVYMYPGYYNALNHPGQWSYAEHRCCPPVAATTMVPHPINHMHSMPASTSTLQPHPPHPQVSFDDLYKIVLAQNEQLKALQSQVERLLLSQDHKPALEACCKSKETENLSVAIRKPDSKVAMEEGTQTSDCEQNEEDCQKMSIGVMTSFIHAVTYRGRVGRLDAVHNVSEHESVCSNGNLIKHSKSSSSDDCSSSSLSPPAKAPQKSFGCTNCCSDCTSQERQNDKSKKHLSKNGKYKQNSNETAKKATSSKSACPEGCNCNNPGVSAAITAVRGCQAVLSSRAGITQNDYSTFDGADLPTVTEQPVSPMSSIHVDLHDYRSSSSDEESVLSQSDESASLEEDEMNPTKEQGSESKPNGWTFYNNVLGQVNKILEERDSGERILDSHHSKAMQHHKSTDVSVSKRVAFEAHEMKENPKHLKEMALKYLRENHPEELAANVPSKKTKTPQSEKLQEMAVYNMPASNMSFATFRYLERYNLLPENFNPQQYLEASAKLPGCHPKPHELHHNSMPSRGSKKMTKVSSGKSRIKSSFPQSPPDDIHYQLQHMGTHQPNPVHHMSPRKQPQFNTPTSKILDITTLRQQPKLL